MFNEDKVPLSHEDQQRLKQQASLCQDQVGAASDVPQAYEPVQTAGIAAPFDPMLRLRIQAREGRRQVHDAERASDILQRHPEFHEFLWLLRSGLV